MENKKPNTVIQIASIAISVVAIVALLYFFGVLKFNDPSSDEYPIRGADVSSYQGEIDWEEFAKNDLDFVYIKATEGSDYVSESFASNVDADGLPADIYIGAYHFFSFSSDGLAQAENFIKTLGDRKFALPPAVDLELYGEYEKERPSAEEVTSELRAMLDKLEEEYGVTPVIYVTEATYNEYVRGVFDDYPLWVRSVYSAPDYAGGANAVFWQYTNRAILKGTRGESMFTDLNVFCGSEEEFRSFIKQ